jgi:hypothetical protein
MGTFLPVFSPIRLHTYGTLLFMEIYISQYILHISKKRKTGNLA